MAIIKLSANEQRRLSAFFTCLVLAALAWLCITLSNPYNYTVKRVLSYKNIPQKRSFHSLQSDTVDVTIKGTGWQMLYTMMHGSSNVLYADLSPLSNGNYVVLGLQQTQIVDGDANHEVVNFNPDTLYFDFLNRMEKRVPIKLLSRISYQQQFAQANNPILRPSYINIVGPTERLNKITEWDTDSLIVKKASETIRTRVNLQPVNEGNITIYPKSVDVVYPIDEFTEKTLQIPVKLINNNEFYNVNMFPQKVTVTFVTSLRRYAETDEDYFEAEADLNLWKNNGYSTLPVKLTRMPPFCKIISVNPQNIDFIVKK
ncbi:CdaR family protein [Mucilaginibacter sp.]